jgi:hypothetical protein
LAGLEAAKPGQRCTDEQIRLCLLLLNAYGVLRVSHINDQPVESWGIPLGRSRRPDGDTIDQYLNTIIRRDEADDDGASAAVSPGQVRPGGLIDTARLKSLVCWAQTGLLTDDVWYFDGHTVEYTGQADIGKTKHGTKRTSVKAVKRFTLFNGIDSLTEYSPTKVLLAEAMRQMVAKANAALPPGYRIRKLAFDKEGWDADLLQWLENEQGIIPITWVKATKPNCRLLAHVPQTEFVPVQEEMTVGKSERETRVVQIADTQVTFPDLDERRVVVLETEAGTRLGIYTTALHPKDAVLDDERAMTTIGLINTMRFKQRIENDFKVETNEMHSDAIPTHKVYEVHQTEPYDVAQAQRQLANAEKRLPKYANQEEQHQRLLDDGQIDKHEFNILNSRTQRLRRQTTRQIKKLKTELDSVEVDEKGQTVRSYTTHVLDLRKLTLLNLFKTHALVALHILAQQLGLDGAGPERLRRQFLPFGDRVEFDHERRIVTVYAQRFPRARTRQAYERLCALLDDLPVTFERNGISYRVRFSW